MIVVSVISRIDVRIKMIGMLNIKILIVSMISNRNTLLSEYNGCKIDHDNKERNE